MALSLVIWAVWRSNEWLRYEEPEEARSACHTEQHTYPALLFGTYGLALEVLRWSERELFQIAFNVV